MRVGDLLISEGYTNDNMPSEDIKEALELGLFLRECGAIYEGESSEEFEMFSIVCEAVAELDEGEVKNAAKSIDGTAVQLFILPNGDKGIAIRSGGKYTFVGGDDTPVAMSESQWNAKEKELLAAGAKITNNAPKPSDWTKTLKAGLRVAGKVVKVLIVLALILVAFKAFLPITASLFTGFAQYTPWGSKLLSTQGFELLRGSVKAEVQGRWLVAKAKNAILGGGMAKNVLKTFY